MHKASCLLLGLCLVAPVVAEDSDMPDQAFLEFLGEWQGDGEAWLDVQKLDDDVSAETGAATEVEDE